MQRKWQVTLVVTSGVFMAGLDLFIVNIAFPAVAADFPGTRLATLSWVLDAYAIVFAALLVPAGRWADAYGRRRTFLAGLSVFALASLACALAPSVGALVGARVVQAVGAALLLPASLGLMLPEFPPSERPVAIGIWAAAGGVAAAAGPPLGGLLVQADWRLVFLVNLPVAAIALAFGRGRLREIREPAARRPDVLGALVLIASVSALVAATVEGGAWGWGSPRIVGLFAAAAVLAAVVVRRSARHPVPVVDPAMLEARGFAIATGASFVFFIGFSAMLLGGVLLLTGPWGKDALTAGLMLAPGPALAAAGSIPAARLATRVGYRVTGLLGSTLFAGAGVWWLTHIGDTAHWVGDFLPGMVISGAGVGLMLPTLTGAGAAALPPERLATGLAVITMGRQIGTAVGVAVLIALLGAGATGADALHAAWWLVVGAAAAAGIALAALDHVPAGAPVPAAAAA